MRLSTFRARLIAFCIALTLGIGAWFLLVHRAPPHWLRRFDEKYLGLSKFSLPPRPQPQVGFVPCRAVQHLVGLPVARTIALREKPDATAPVIKQLSFITDVEILEATRDFIHIRYPDFREADLVPDEEKVEGWVSWESVVPDDTSIVTDAGTGTIIMRLPFSGVVNFSPDGSRVLFGTIEVETSYYKPTGRCLVADADYEIADVYYGQHDGALYAVVRRRIDYSKDEKSSALTIVRVSDTGGPSVPTGFTAMSSYFELSEDKSTGFNFRDISQDFYTPQMDIDIVDLATFKIRNTLHLKAAFGGVSTLFNASGSELYYKACRDQAIHVMDAGTGQNLREIPDESESCFISGKIVDDTLVLRDSKTNHKYYWGRGNERAMSEPAIYTAIERNGHRFATNLNSTQLFRLDGDDHIISSFAIERPEIKSYPDAIYFVHGGVLTASPDGQRVILFTHYSFEAHAVFDCSETDWHHHNMSKH